MPRCANPSHLIFYSCKASASGKICLLKTLASNAAFGIRPSALTATISTPSTISIRIGQLFNCKDFCLPCWFLRVAVARVGCHVCLEGSLSALADVSGATDGFGNGSGCGPAFAGMGLGIDIEIGCDVASREAGMEFDIGASTSASASVSAPRSEPGSGTGAGAGAGISAIGGNLAFSFASFASFSAHSLALSSRTVLDESKVSATSNCDRSALAVQASLLWLIPRHLKHRPLYDAAYGQRRSRWLLHCQCVEDLSFMTAEFTYPWSLHNSQKTGLLSCSSFRAAKAAAFCTRLFSAPTIRDMSLSIRSRSSPICNSLTKARSVCRICTL